MQNFCSIDYYLLYQDGMYHAVREGDVFGSDLIKPRLEYRMEPVPLTSSLIRMNVFEERSLINLL